MSADTAPRGQVGRVALVLPPRPFSQWLAVLVNTLLAMVLGAVVLTLFLTPRDSEFLNRPLLGMVLSTLALGVGAMLIRHRVGMRVLSRTQTIGWASGLTVFSCVVAYFSEFDYGWDPKAVRQATYELSATGHLDDGLLAYFARYPNNLPLTLVESPLTGMARATGLPFFDVLVLWNGALFCGVLMLTASSLRRLSRARWTLPVFGLLTLLLGCSTHMATPYTDLPGCFFAALFIYLGVRLRENGSRAYALMCVMAVAAGVCYLLKPYVLVIPIAGLVMFVVSGGMMTLRRTWGGRGMAARLLVLPFIIFAASAAEKDLAYSNAHVSAGQLAAYNAPFPVLHWVAMGIHDNGSTSPSRSYGSFDMGIMRRDVNIKDGPHRGEVIRKGIETDLKRQGVGGTLSFMAKKIAWVLGDSTFYAQKDGTDGSAHARKPGLVAAFTLRDGGAFHVKAGFVQAVWGALLLALAGGLVRSRRDVTIAWLSLALIGFILYEAVFEGRPRYVVAVLPAFVTLFALTRDVDARATRRGRGERLRDRST